MLALLTRLCIAQPRRITLSSEEKAVFGQLFKQCDPEGLGIVTGDVARPLFERSGLPAYLLGEIWQIADDANNGFLDQTGFSVALRLIGRVQGGQRLSANVDAPGPLPSFDGRQRLEPTGTGSDANVTRVPPLSATDRQRFASLFEKNAFNGMISGEKARDIFLKAKLSTDTLGEIWNLADSQERGSLNETEFIVAMHFIQGILTGSIKKVPSQLPPELIEAAAGKNHGPVSRSAVMRSGSVTSQSAPVQRQYSGAPVVGRESPMLRANTTGQADWRISPQERARFDHIFAGLDKAGNGDIGADEVVPFLTSSKLPEDDLAKIWDLSDLQNTGRLGKIEFAIAMYLVQQRLARRELPDVVPPSLLASASSNPMPPPSSRHSMIAPSGPNPVFFPGVDSNERSFTPPVQRPKPVPAPAPAPAAAPAPAPAANSSLKDLVDLNDLFSSPSPAISSPASPPAPKVESQSTTSASKFVPTSNFGQSIVNNPSLMSSSRSASQATTIVRHSADADPANDDHAKELNARLVKANTDLGELSGQWNSVSTQHQQALEQKTQIEAELNKVLEAKKDLEGKLTLLRTNYDSEVQRVHQARDSLQVTAQENQKLSQDYALLEASMQALEQQYQSAFASLTQAQNENASLKEKTQSINDQTAQLSKALEDVEQEANRVREEIAVARTQQEAAEQARLNTESSLKKAQEELTALRTQASSVATVDSRNLESAQTPTPVTSVYTTMAAGAVAGAATAASVASAASAASHPFTSESSYNSRSSSVIGSGNPFARRPSQQSASTNERLFEDSFRNMDVNSPSTANPTRSSIQATETTPQSSPPTSDFAFHNPDAGAATIPSFTLPLARPQSATSSVQNNAPLSVRGDFDSSRPESPIYTSEPVSGIVPPESMELAHDQDEAGHQYGEHVLTADEFQAQSASVTSVPRSSVGTVVDAPIHAPATTEHISGTVPATASASTEQLHETPDSFEFVNAEDSDRSAGGSPSLPTSVGGGAGAELPNYSESQAEAGVPASTTSVRPPVATTAPDIDASEGQTFGSSGDFSTKDSFDGERNQSSGVASSEQPNFTGDNQLAHRTGNSLSTETEDEDLYEDASSNIPGGFPGSFPAQQPEISPKDSANEFQFYSQGPPPTTFGQPARTLSTSQSEPRDSTFPDVPFGQDHVESSTESASLAPAAAFAPTQIAEEESESSDDDEGPEEVIPSRSAGQFTAEQKGKATDKQPYYSPVPAEDETDFVFAPATRDQNHQMVDSRSQASSAGNAFATESAPPPVPPKEDIFANAFDDLDDAQEEKDGDATGDYSQNLSDFDRSFGQFDNSVSVAPAATISSAEEEKPRSVPSSNDEWEQLFEGFGESGNGATATQSEINDAFASSTGASQAPVARSESPKTRALTELTSIGFDKADALDALQKHNYDISQASNYLLDKS